MKGHLIHPASSNAHFIFPSFCRQLIHRFEDGIESTLFSNRFDSAISDPPGLPSTYIQEIFEMSSYCAARDFNKVLCGSAIDF